MWHAKVACFLFESHNNAAVIVSLSRFVRVGLRVGRTIFESHTLSSHSAANHFERL